MSVIRACTPSLTLASWKIWNITYVFSHEYEVSLVACPHGYQVTEGTLTHWPDTWPRYSRAITALTRCFVPVNIMLAVYRDEHTCPVAVDKANQSEEYDVTESGANDVDVWFWFCTLL